MARDKERKGKEGAGKDETPASPSRGGLPLFYKTPQILTVERHDKAGIRDDASFAFARDTNSVPLGADEIFVAQGHYPVVFTPDDPAIPVAVVGIGGSRNAFVGPGGAWRAGAYVPAYIRRYPFILVAKPGSRDFVLAVDEAADTFAAKAKAGDRRLFEGGQATPFVRQSAEFCRAFESQVALARAFGEALAKAGVLVLRRADIRLPDGKTVSLGNFRIIDEARFNALSDDTFLAWRRSGVLGLAYAHLLSMRRWLAVVPPA